MTPRRLALVIAAAGLLLLIGLGGALGVMVLANGVLATAAPAWSTEVRWAGRSVRVSVPGLVRLATAPGVAHLIDGRSLQTPAGRIAFRRDGAALIARCAPCRWQHDALASAPLVLTSVELRAERSGALVTGWLSVDQVRVDYTAELAADGIRLRWQLPPTELRRAYAALATVVPEAAVARIEGTLAAGGQLQLPQRSGSMKFHAEAIEVGGLGTEALQFGSFAMACRDAGGAPRRTLTGDSEPRWITLDRMGMLPAAVVAAEDQRFELHPGYDDTELASLLASVEPEGLRRGASTLTQQLARTLFTGGEKTVARKLRELLYAIEMERTLGKPRILELYLNTVDWGPGLCGARDAARTYFRKRPEQLTPLEAAWLAGILRAPHAAHAQQFVGGTVDAERARWVLMQMRGMARSERERWRRKPLVLAAPRPSAAAGSAPRQADRNTPIAEGAVEVAEPPRHRRGAARAVAVVR